MFGLPQKLLDLGFLLVKGVLYYGETSCTFKLEGKNCTVTLPNGDVFHVEGVDSIKGEHLSVAGQGQVGLDLG